MTSWKAPDIVIDAAHQVLGIPRIHELGGPNLAALDEVRPGFGAARWMRLETSDGDVTVLTF